MRSNRNEPFRYVFSEPIACLFQIIIPGEPEPTPLKGRASILDISLEGMKLKSKLNLHIKTKDQLQLLVYFKLNDKELTYLGSIVWQKYRGTFYHYGVKLFVDEYDKEELMKLLKSYSRTHDRAVTK